MGAMESVNPRIDTLVEFMGDGCVPGNEFGAGDCAARRVQACDRAGCKHILPAVRNRHDLIAEVFVVGDGHTYPVIGY